MDMTAVFPDLIPVIPELVMATGAMLLLMYGVFAKGANFATASRLAMLIMALAIVALFTVSRETAVTFGGLFVQDTFALFMKTLALLGAIAIVPMAAGYLKDFKLDKFEFPTLMLTSVLGMMMMLSAGDFLSLYLGLELQSLSLYILAAFNTERPRSSEAGLKYFVLGALSSGMLLYGISLIYGFNGTTGFALLSGLLSGGANTGTIFGLVFVLVGLGFKVSAVPFHMWTPDVYEGAPTPVTAFFAAAPKIAAMGLLLRVMMDAFPEIIADWRAIIIALSVASMAIGAFVALMQTNIKRLMAYSSIGHVGYALIGLAAGTVEGIQSVIVYMTIYITMTLGTFGCILMMRRDDGMAEEIDDLAGLSRRRPLMAFALMIFMFSLAGVPPVAGFLGKWFVFWAAVDAGLVWLAVTGFVLSVVGAVYYLRIVKVMYFDEPAEDFLDNESKGTSLVVGITAILNSPVSFLLIAPLLAAAMAAATALVG